ncbi:MAG: hypothetical protein ABI036_17490 [Fibrobacteria bacterium]
MRISQSVPLLLWALSGCSNLDLDCKPAGRIIFPDSLVNLAALNSPYDDWNCGAPWDEWESDGSFLFSTNRKTSGGTFDVFPTAIRFQGEDGFAMDTSLNASEAIRAIAKRINTGEDELGPTFWFASESDLKQRSPKVLIFSRGNGGNHDLWVLSPDNPTVSYVGLLYPPDSLFEIPLTPLNTPKDEGYATWSRELGLLFFHSDRDGIYGLFQASIPLDSNGLGVWLRNPKDSGVRISRVQGLSSDGQERCPFLLGNALYFVSDRSGGFGGLDIYRSVWSGTAWGAPQNLGSRINSTYDEYRPLAFHLYPEEDALFFSSNRPGGKGGYDLYATSLKPEL